MTQKLLISMLAVFLAAGNALAENTVIKKHFSLSEAEKTWGSDDCLTINSDGFTFDAGTTTTEATDASGNKTTTTVDNYGNAAIGWTTVTDISDYTNLVLKLDEATTSTVEIVVANDGFWGMAKNYTTTLAQGDTEISIPVASMTKNGDGGDGSALDLTAINLIFLRTGWVHEQTIKIKEFYLEKVTLDTDAKDCLRVPSQR